MCLNVMERVREFQRSVFNHTIYSYLVLGKLL